MPTNDPVEIKNGVEKAFRKLTISKEKEAGIKGCVTLITVMIQTFYQSTPNRFLIDQGQTLKELDIYAEKLQELSALIDEFNQSTVAVLDDVDPSHIFRKTLGIVKNGVGSARKRLKAQHPETPKKLNGRPPKKRTADIANILYDQYQSLTGKVPVHSFNIPSKKGSGLSPFSELVQDILTIGNLRSSAAYASRTVCKKRAAKKSSEKTSS